MTKKVIAIDTETHLLEDYNKAPKVVCVSWADEVSSDVYADPDTIEAWLTDHLRMSINQELILVGHNIAYDAACLLRTFPKLWDLIFEAYHMNGITDTMVREKLLDLAKGEYKKKKGYSLDKLAKRNLGKELQKKDTWRLRYKELDGIPIESWPSDAVEYSRLDAVTTLQVYQGQCSRADTINYPIPTQYHDTRAAMSLHLMSVWGVTTDQEYVTKRWNETADEMLTVGRQLKETGIITLQESRSLFDDTPVELPNTKKNDKLIRELVEKSFPGTPPRTKTGKIQANADAINQCNHPTLVLLQKFKSLEKEANTYLRHFKKPVIHAYFDAVGTDNNRTSCDSPNLQNLPRKPGFRECIVAREGSTLMFSDFDAHEMRTLAQSCLDLLGKSQLARKYQHNPGFDPHQDFANHAGCSRQSAKIANFGYPGGLSAKTCVTYARSNWGLNITLEESEKLRAGWLRQWPEMNTYFDHCSSLTGVENYGLQIIPRSGFRRNGVDFKQAANGYFSTLAAHGSKAALWEVTRHSYCNRRSPLYGARPVLFIHDEIGLEIDKEQAEEGKREMEKLMTEAMIYWTPDIPSRAGAECMERWTK